MKRIIISLIAAGVLGLGTAPVAYAQGASTDANVNKGVNPSPGAMPNRTPQGTKEVSPATGAPMGGSHSPDQKPNTQK
jgi:hypothetical protein